MGWDLNVSSGELRASAGAAEALATDLQDPLRRARADLASAASAFGAWTVGSQMAQTGEGWASALETLRGRLSDHAQGLRQLADGRDVLEQDVISCFRGW